MRQIHVQFPMRCYLFLKYDRCINLSRVYLGFWCCLSHCHRRHRARDMVNRTQANSEALTLAGTRYGRFFRSFSSAIAAPLTARLFIVVTQCWIREEIDKIFFLLGRRPLPKRRRSTGRRRHRTEFFRPLHSCQRQWPQYHLHRRR